MLRKLKIFIMIFALGAFIVPNQFLSAQVTEMSCCTSNDSSKDCCKTKQQDKPCHDTKEKNSCGDQCTSCASCHFTAILFYKKTEEPFSSVGRITAEKEDFTYITPEFSGIFHKIWQPPKIG